MKNQQISTKGLSFTGRYAQRDRLLYLLHREAGLTIKLIAQLRFGDIDVQNSTLLIYNNDEQTVHSYELDSHDGRFVTDFLNGIKYTHKSSPLISSQKTKNFFTDVALRALMRRILGTSASSFYHNNVNANSAPRKLLSEGDVAKLIGCCNEHVARLRRMGSIKCIKFGKLIRYDPDHIDIILRSGSELPSLLRKKPSQSTTHTVDDLSNKAISIFSPRR